MELLRAWFGGMLGVRFALVVFLSIAAVEAAILIPSVRNYERDLLARLEHAGRAGVMAAFRTQSHADERSLLIYAKVILGATDLSGGALYRADGTLIGTFGETPVLTPAMVAAGEAPRRRSADGDRLEVLWPHADNRLPMTVVGRLDATFIGPELTAFVWRIAGLVLLLSVVVCTATMLVFRHLVGRPIGELHRRLDAARDDPANPSAHVLETRRRYELGQVSEAFNGMIRRIGDDIVEQQEARRALKEANDQLEARVADRTKELVTSNESLRHEVAERQRAEDALRHDAFHDRLTGLPNRDLLIDRTNHAIRAARRERTRTFALLLVNLDRFKVVNDSLGHLAGDELLLAVAERITATVRPGDSVARVGADEFAILVADLTRPEDVAACGRRIRESLAPPFMIEAQEIFCTVSIGVAVGSMGYIRADSMIQDAALALHEAKTAGKDRFKVFDPSMRTGATGLLRVESDLRRAIEQGDQLVLHYQPIVDLETGLVAGFEALVRWRHPERGLLAPGEFISLSEDTGLIVPLGRWILLESARQAAAWRRQMQTPVYISVNVSSRQLSEGVMTEDVSRAIAQDGVTPDMLRLEVTESLLMDNPVLAGKMLQEIRDMDVKLCIDDLGTGYSSLGYLRRFPFDVLKIDRSFITTITEGRESREIIGTVIELGRVLGKQVVAEGAETEEEVRILRDLRCAMCQGFFFAPGLEAREAASLMDAPPWSWRPRSAAVRPRMVSP